MAIRAWRPSISLLAAMMVVFPIVIVSTVLVGLSWASSARISEDLARTVMDDASRSVAAEVREYLADAVAVSDRYARRLGAGVLPDPPGIGWERAMLDDLATSPNVASICYGNTEGDTTWLLRRRGRLEVGRAEGRAGNRTLEFVVDPTTAATVGPPLREYVYDPRTRPWWATAQETPEACWTPIYRWYTDNSADTAIGAGYARKILDHSGVLRGVVVVDVTLGALGDFLRHLDVSSRGRAFIIDTDGRLVAASSGTVANDKGERLLLGQSLTPESNAKGKLFNANLSSLRIDGEPTRVEMTALNPYRGIRWRLVTALPESAFLSEAQAVRRRALQIGGAVAAASLVMGLGFSRYLSRPLIQMTRHVQRVGAGDFDARLDLRAARELTVLSDEINKMAGGLKQRMLLEQSLAVAMEVQQSLLPAKDPTHANLDVAGRSRYCDDTGGDYYDFVDISAVSESSLLIAVGDVMGHGIAAALLMASARAALRTRILDRPDLGELMTRTNKVLAANNRHNRFMTLVLMTIDGLSGAVAWASAGHDPAIVYDAAADQFRELEGGEIPLGIMEDMQYTHYGGHTLGPDSVLIVGTDGVWETFSEKKELYGKDRLRAVLRAHHREPAAQIGAELEKDLAAFRGAGAYTDDVTFVIVKPISRSAGAKGSS